MRHRKLFIALILLAAYSDARLLGQELDPKDNAAQPGKTAATKFAAAAQAITDVNVQAQGLVAKFRAAETDQEKDLIRKQFAELSQQMDKLLPQLRTAAQAAYLESPNQDVEVTRVMVSMVVDDIRKDRYESADKLGKVLVDHKCKDMALPGMLGEVAFCLNDFPAAEKFLKQADENGTISRIGQRYLAGLEDARKNWKTESEIRAREAKANDLPRVRLTTSKGDIVLELFENEAPQAVANFVNLVEKKFYDGLTFHRVLGNFMAQGGCPRGDGTGGPGYSIYCECQKEPYRRHFRGTLSMAHAGKDTGGSQFFLTFRPTPHLDGRHTAFGRVIEGMEVLAKLQRIDPNQAGPKPDTIEKAVVQRKRDHKYEPKKVE